MNKKKDLSQEDKKTWEDYIKDPSDIYDKTVSVYESFKIHVRTDNKTPHQVVEEIINLYNA